VMAWAATLGTAHAQTTSDAAEPKVEQASSGDIVVTAQRREERLRDVPIAVSAFNMEALQARNITNVNNLQGFVPNVKIFTQGYATSTTISMRGSVVFNNAPYFEPVVGQYVDGVYMGKARGGAIDNVDVERIEVLRGPQGTLYGRNTLAGALNIVSAKPTGEFGGSAKAGIGDMGAYFAQGAVNLPAFESGIGTFKVKVSGRREVREGMDNVPNQVPAVTTARSIKQDHLDGVDSWAGRLAVRYEPSDNWTTDYALDYSKQDNTPAFSQLTHIDAGGVFDPTSPIYNGIPIYQYLDVNNRKDTASVNGGDLFGGLSLRTFERAEVIGNSLTNTWDLGSVTLKSISGYRTLDYSEARDYDGTPLQVVTTYTSALKHKAFSQEFQATGSIGENIQYTGGLYYYWDKGDFYSGQSFFGGLTLPYYGYGTDAKAAYGQIEWKPGGGPLTLTAGLRYNEETKKVRRETVNGLTGVVTIPYTTAEGDFDGWQPTFIAKYDITDDLNVYAKYARGFKSGGFNPEAPNVAETKIGFKPEGVDSFEIGSKSSLFDRKLQMNLAAFYDKHTDLQLSVFDPSATTASSVVRNAGKSTIWGIEAEVQATPTEWLKLQGTLGYLNTKYDEFITGGINVADDRAFPYAPEYTWSISADARLWKRDLTELHMLIDYTHSDSFYVFPYSLNPLVAQNAVRTEIDANDPVDLRFRATGFKVGGLDAEASFGVKNLFDEEYKVGALDFGSGFFGGLITNIYARERTWQADFGIKF
jgi:iron complex outermembrane recepter protein